MNVPRRDLFESWRLLLTVVCAVYVTLMTGRSLWRIAAQLSGPGRTTSIVRRYVTIQLLRVRLRRHWAELLQIAALLVILAMLMRAHVA